MRASRLRACAICVTVSPSRSCRSYELLRATGDLEVMPARTRNQWTGDNNTYRQNIPPERGLTLLNRLFPVLQQLAVEFEKNNVAMVVGTDSSRNIPFSAPGLSFHRELAALQTAGLSNHTILKAATMNPAQLLGQPNLGSIEEGKIADLVILSNNPLADITNMSAIEVVIRAGSPDSRATLEDELRRIIKHRR